MSAVLTISFLFVHISGADHAYWLPLNAFLLLRPMYEDSRYRMLSRFLGTAGGCIIMSLLFPVLSGMQGHFALAALMVICMYTATPGTCVHAVCVTCFALSMVTLAMGEETAIELRMVYVMGAVFLVLVINRFFFPTSMGQQFRYNLTVVFHMHHMYLRMLERALERPTDYWTICDAQVEYHLVHGQMMEYLDKRKGQLWELYRELLGISWEMAAEIEQILLFRMTLKPLGGIPAGGAGLFALGSHFVHGGSQQLPCHALSPQGIVHKGVVDVHHAVLPGGEGDLGQQLAVVSLGVDAALAFFEFHSHPAPFQISRVKATLFFPKCQRELQGCGNPATMVPEK